MKYTLFKLYHTQGLRYPPTEDQALKEAGCFLLAIKPTPIDAAVGSDLVLGTMGMIESKAEGNFKSFFNCCESTDELYNPLPSNIL